MTATGILLETSPVHINLDFNGQWEMKTACTENSVKSDKNHFKVCRLCPKMKFYTVFFS